MRNYQKAIDEINKAGALLVFSVKDKKDPQSLWSRFYPRSKMRWEWDETGDSRVVDLWHLMKLLAKSSEVVYSKWYQNRAMFFSRELFTALLSYTTKSADPEAGLSPHAKTILATLQQDSPLSTKELKELTDLKGKFNESFYNKAIKQLFQRCLIVGFGEKEDGAFPSALMGASQLLFEDLWKKSKALTELQAEKTIHKYLQDSPALLKQFKKNTDYKPK